MKNATGLLTELNPQALWTADVEGRVLYANQRFLEYIGKDFVPKDGTEYLQCFYEGDRDRVLQVWSHCVATGEDYVIDARLLRASDGEARWWHLRAPAPCGMQQETLSTGSASATDVHENRMATRTVALTVRGDRAAAAGTRDGLSRFSDRHGSL